MFAAQVARIPDEIAVTFCGPPRGPIGELDQASNRLARQLVAAAARARDATSHCCCRVPAQAVVAIMAVVKTGAAYLPMDPDGPDTRIHFMR